MVEDRIVKLGAVPRPPGAKPLQGKKYRGLYRIRSGDYRVIYQVRDDSRTVVVVKIGDRKDVYE